MSVAATGPRVRGTCVVFRRRAVTHAEGSHAISVPAIDLGTAPPAAVQLRQPLGKPDGRSVAHRRAIDRAAVDHPVLTGGCVPVAVESSRDADDTRIGRLQYQTQSSALTGVSGGGRSQRWIGGAATLLAAALGARAATAQTPAPPVASPPRSVAPTMILFHADLDGQFAPVCGQPPPVAISYAGLLASIDLQRAAAPVGDAPPPVVLLGGNWAGPDPLAFEILSGGAAGARTLAALLAAGNTTPSPSGTKSCHWRRRCSTSSCRCWRGPGCRSSPAT